MSFDYRKLPLANGYRYGYNAAGMRAGYRWCSALPIIEREWCPTPLATGRFLLDLDTGLADEIDYRMMLPLDVYLYEGRDDDGWDLFSVCSTYGYTVALRPRTDGPGWEWWDYEDEKIVVWDDPDDIRRSAERGIRERAPEYWEG